MYDSSSRLHPYAAATRAMPVPVPSASRQIAATHATRSTSSLDHYDSATSIATTRSTASSLASSPPASPLLSTDVTLCAMGLDVTFTAAPSIGVSDNVDEWVLDRHAFPYDAAPGLDTAMLDVSTAEHNKTPIRSSGLASRHDSSRHADTTSSNQCSTTTMVRSVSQFASIETATYVPMRMAPAATVVPSNDTHVHSVAAAVAAFDNAAFSKPQKLGKHSFNVGSRYRVCDVIGEGAYGVVCSAIHRPTGQKVAIKKIQPFEHQMFALRTLRELKLLRYFQEMDVCENIISILDVVKPPSFDQFHEVYLIQELMETDLHRVVRSQKLSDDHAQYFIYQILRALKVMHSADVIHRDLKPSNLLLNANCDLKVCDFGLARSVLTAEPGGTTGYMTEYVATRWYRAPEIMLTFKQYTKAIDVWSVGCILAEMITGRPLFPGRDYHNQISLILDVLGTPNIDDFQAITSRRSRDYLRQLSLRKRKDFNKLFAGATPEAIDFLQKTLAFNPKKRPTVEECLAHPYLAAYHDPDDEPSVQSLPPSYFAYDLQPRPSAAQLREQMWKEVESLPRYI